MVVTLKIQQKLDLFKVPSSLSINFMVRLRSEIGDFRAEILLNTALFYNKSINIIFTVTVEVEVNLKLFTI